ncbi:TPR-like protein [Massarina eburnea CBS 473.64]|uniref:TPR-like protein n=1 Tax=Massarina eburnea CBS 473.64 TaxID=1395130 RepID=A0A6A6RXK9_9PLEO|nr:TPR-like protein [Massarina eburnea CBS 473.64]
MADILLSFFRSTLPDELAAVLIDVLQAAESGDFASILQQPEVKLLLGHEENEVTKDVKLKDFSNWSDYIFHRLGLILSKRTGDEGAPAQETAAYRQHLFLIVAIAALYAFIQSSITGPPLPFNSADVLLPKEIASDSTALRKIRAELVASLGTDGVAAYKLTPNVELLCLAETILICPPIQKNIETSVWARLRTSFAHQRLLSEPAPSLQKAIYDDLESLEGLISNAGKEKEIKDLHVHFLLERATIHTHHGLDKKAKLDMDQATKERHFEFVLTGLMGKRTKFQQSDTSQLLVLARSTDGTSNGTATPTTANGPENLNLNDDTLLESISFTPEAETTETKTESSVPESLASLDPSNQPLLDPLDSVILLSLALTITNTNPADGITREETLPYATRVLEGGSSNWQVYTQALLVRSRIEGYKSRTLERGLLQLQALVDQVIADTSSTEPTTNGEEPTSFLPRAKDSEAAPVNERLHYVFSLCSPSRWDLESELASRWVSVGGLRSALEIYERLELWAEAALCWAATDKEEKAKRIIRRQLFHATSGDDAAVDLEEEKWEGAPRDPPPAEAPRLYCILGDIDKDLTMYEKAWEVSGNRYARAQRSLGQNYFFAHEYEKAAKSYELSLKLNPLNQPARFALGCAYLELQRFKDAVEAFSRCVQLDDQDAESWSNLAAALLHLRPKTVTAEDEDGEERTVSGRVTSHPRTDALKAFKRAAELKHDSYRIWNNVLAVAASTNPPSWHDVITSQRRICEIRGKTDGEACIDAEVISLLVRHIVQSDEPFDITKPGSLPRFVNELIEKHIKPLITFSPQLWSTLATLYMHTDRPSSALECHEKAWRAVTAQPNWEAKTEKEWDVVVRQTIDLVDAYETLGPRERTEGLAAGSGELVAKDWKFKARSALRSIMGKGKEGWEDTSGWESLKERLGEL